MPRRIFSRLILGVRGTESKDLAFLGIIENADATQGPSTPLSAVRTQLRSG
ncbi:MAG TPA: hypothetical protein VD837_10325 [Terriglobales bacterium]|nr:hypothetical protein [Terriglobales bacterium]